MPITRGYKDDRDMIPFLTDLREDTTQYPREDRHLGSYLYQNADLIKAGKYIIVLWELQERGGAF